MFVSALTRIQIRIHTLHTFLFLSKLEVSKLSRFISQWNVTHTHTCPRIYTRLMSKNTVLCARLAPPSNLLVVGITLLSHVVWRLDECDYITRLRLVLQTHTRQKTFHRTRSVMYYFIFVFIWYKRLRAGYGRSGSFIEVGTHSTTFKILA